MAKDNLQVIKKYSWWDYEKATKESGKSLAELFDFETGKLIWKGRKQTSDIIEK